MIIRRWQAPVSPDKKQIQQMFYLEGLSPKEEVHDPESESKERKFPFDRVHMIAEGEIILNVAGNKVLLRAGDRVMLPSNTKHSINVKGKSKCILYYAYKVLSTT